MEDYGRDYIAPDHVVISENPPFPLTLTKTFTVSGRKLCFADPKVPKIVLMVGAIMNIVPIGQDEDDVIEVNNQKAVLIVMDPANGEGITFTHALEFELENVDEGAGNEDVLPYYSPVDIDAFCKDYDTFTHMIPSGAPSVQRGLVSMGWQVPDTARIDVWNDHPTEYDVKYQSTGLFDRKAQCFDMGKGFRLLVPGFDKREPTVPTRF
jgi:hypothetical protein